MQINYVEERAKLPGELSAKDKLNFLLSTNFDYENFSLTWIPKVPFR